MKWFGASVLPIAAGLAILAVPVVAIASEMAMLDTLTRGSWELRDRSSDMRQRICVRTGEELIQLRHAKPACERFIVRNGPSAVTVQYTCRGNGYGRTTIRKEGNGLVQIRSQGIFNGTPFVIEGEARRVGAC